MILYILLYGCETWTLHETLEKRINSFESKSYRRILGISYRERKTNDYLFKILIEAIGYVEPLISTIKRRKLAHFCHTIRHKSFHKVIMQGFVQGKRRQGRPRTNWMYNIIEWTKSDIGDLLENTLDREKWKKTCVIAAIQIV